MLISVIVPIYNVSGYLEKCISSIQNQTYRKLEIILVDDGSTDSSGEICDRFAQDDDRIIVVHKKNEGLVSARKTGLKIVQGDYIAFVDGDDWIEPGFYEDMLKAVISQNVDFVESSYIREQAGTSILYEIMENYFVFDESTAKCILESWMEKEENALIRNTIWSKLYRAEVIKESYIHVPEKMSFGEDIINYIYLLKIARSAYVVPKAGYHYIYRSNSLAHDISLRKVRKHNELLGICSGLIEEEYPYISKKKIDVWYVMRCLPTFHNIHLGREMDMPNYEYSNVEDIINKKIVIYGAGNVGRDLYFQFSKYEKCSIVAWVDKNYQRYNFSYYNVKPVEEGLNRAFDIVIIAVLREALANSIKEELIARGVPGNKIVWKPPVNLIDKFKTMGKEIHTNIVRIMGGLGNQMFQYAFFKSMQEKGLETFINIDDLEKEKKRFELSTVFPEVRFQLDRDHKFDAYKNSFSYHELFCENEHGVYDRSVYTHSDASFLGYWQSEKYFRDISDQIRNDFRFDIKDKSLVQLAKKITGMPGAVSVHVRRGDYLDVPEMYCGICTSEYYSRAIQYMTDHIEEPQFVFFSDDLQWVHENLSIENAVYVEASMFESYSNWYDMYLMTCCKHNIIANSSFSWWGAWLNNNEKKIVVAPDKWLNNENTIDIWCEGWVRI